MHRLVKQVFQKDYIQALLLFLFTCPVFFQLTGNLFTSYDFIYDTQGKLTLVPLPVASIFCFLGIALLLRLEKHHFGMGVIFSVFILMMLSIVVFSSEVGKPELAKFILIVQFILPMFALVLGRLYLAPTSDYLKYEALGLYVLLLIIPLEVIATYLRGSVLLSPYLYLFSLYQHLQYLPVIFVSLYFLAIGAVSVNRNLKLLTLFIAPWMGVYLAASLSLLAEILAVIASLVSFLVLRKSGKAKYILALLALLWLSFSFYHSAVQETPTYAQKFDSEQTKYIVKRPVIDKRVVKEPTFSEKVIQVLPNNLQHRLYYWEFYVKGVIDSPKVFFFGNPTRPSRDTYPSAQNYYLDFIYSFGVVAVLPLFFLIFYTVKAAWLILKTDTVSDSTVILLVLVMFYIFFDNFLKVGFRQPYPGMIMFFLWGLLLSRLPNPNLMKK